MVLAPKKDGKIQIFVDYRVVNLATVADKFRLPRLDDCIDRLGDASVFSTLDGNCGYWKIPVREADRDETFFTTHSGTYRFRRRNFGFRNALETFQSVLVIILSRICWQRCLIYIDVVIVFSESDKQHLEDVEEILKLLRNSGVTLKLINVHYPRKR